MSVPATQHMPEQGAGNRRILVILAYAGLPARSSGRPAHTHDGQHEKQHGEPSNRAQNGAVAATAHPNHFICRFRLLTRTHMTPASNCPATSA